MSDFGNDDFMHDDDGEDEYDFEYSDAGEDEPDVDLENKYYSAKGMKDDDPAASISEFQSVLDTEDDKSEWGFKALKQIVKVCFKLQRFDDVLKFYQKLFDYAMAPVITKNYSEKSINNLLDYVSNTQNEEFLEKFYDLTLHALSDKLKNERLFVKANLKLAKLWLDRKEYNQLKKVLKKLKEIIDQKDALSADDFSKKGTHLLEIYAIEIQMYTETKNNKKLKELYHQCLAVKSAIPHPRILGVVRECGGKMHMQEKQWELAQQDFFEAFKNYDEAGSMQRIQCLKYLVLANMLTESEINPFDSQETKPYKNDAQIIVMTNLVSAFQRREIVEFEKILKENRASIMGDPFIKDYMDDVLQNIRNQVLVQIVAPYQTVSLPYLCEQLGGGVSVKEVENLLVGLILSGKISGRIDQLNGLLELSSKPGFSELHKRVEQERYDALLKWTDALQAHLDSVKVK